MQEEASEMVCYTTFDNSFRTNSAREGSSSKISVTVSLARNASAAMVACASRPCITTSVRAPKCMCISSLIGVWAEVKAPPSRYRLLLECNEFRPKPSVPNSSLDSPTECLAARKWSPYSYLRT